MKENRPAVFLDRDGTVVRDSGYIRSPEEVVLLPGVAAAIRSLREARFAVVVVTNQSGIARGLLDEKTLSRIHARLRERLGTEGTAVDGIFFCPHHPEEGEPPYRRECDCRKPKPGLLLRAASVLGLDLARSYAVGDGTRDLEAALAAGVRFISLGFEDPRAVHHAEDLGSAARWILSREKGGSGTLFQGR